MSGDQSLKTNYEIFLSYYTEDEVWYTNISELLEQQSIDDSISITCRCMNDFTPGPPLLTCITSAIEDSDITLVIVTNEAVSRDWLKYEFMHALEKSQQQQRLSVGLVLVDVDEQLVQELWHGQIHENMIIKIRSNEDWNEKFLEDMVGRIKDIKHMEPIQVAVNLSVGQVWSHFFGYSKNVMPVLKQKIKTSQWYAGNETRFPLKEFNLIPKSASAVESLSDIHPDIVSEGAVGVIIAERGSYKNRPYKPPVYSILDKSTGQRYYFVAHIPNTLSVLSEKQLNLQKKVGNYLEISPGERALQVARFSIMFNHLLNHPLNVECNDMVELIEYDDKQPGEDFVQLLLNKVKRACPKILDKDITPLEQGVHRLHSENADTSDDYDNTVYIDYPDDDENTADDLKTFLKSKQINIWENEKPGEPVFKIIAKAAQHAKWFVFILSKTNLTEVLQQQCRMVLQESIFQNEVRLIPLLSNDIKEQDLPGDLRAVLFLNISSADYKEAIAGIIKCRSIKMEAKVSVKGIHAGLAWAYALNYLQVIKVNFCDEETSKLSAKLPEAKIHLKLFLLVPKSCRTKQLGELVKDSNGELIDPNRFKLLDKEYEILSSRFINGIQRDYPLLPYMIVDDNNQEHIVFAEFINPIKCMQEMLEPDIRSLSGFTSEIFDDEVDKFQTLLKEIIQCQELHEQFAVVFYDDNGTDVFNILLELLKHT
ncbi:hypothetical protein ACF0H5_007528 [Mactra antiquata]